MAPKEKKGKKKFFSDKKSKGKVEQNDSNDSQKEKTPAAKGSKHKSQNEKKLKKGDSFIQDTKMFLQRIFSRRMLYELIFNPYYFSVAACAFLILEALINVFIIENVQYTEIDWMTYMQQVEGFLNGTFDYTKLKGDTGPLVYPAGFLYVFSMLYYATDKGTNIYLAQYIFAGIYLLTLALVFRIYHKSKKLPPYALVFMCCMSYRVHSIFVLRLFNDPVAMAVFYGALNCFISERWTLGSLLFSFAVSIKMNILLYAPALLMSYLYCLGVLGTLVQLSLCFIVQVLLALPFLVENPLGYILQAFNLGRVFLFEWTVNWRFLPEDIFLHPYFHLGLLAAHVLVLCILAFTHWNRYLIHLGSLQGSKLEVSCQLLLLPMFMSNFVGMSFSRSLHYQFYVWYFHTLPYLLWSTQLGIPARLLLLGLIELCWNTFPSTWWSSALLHVCHSAILVALVSNRPSKDRIQSIRKRLTKAD